MPLYEYRCNNCKIEFEKIVSFSEADLKQQCPRCGSNQTIKKISAASVIGGTSANGTKSTSSTSGNCGSGGGFT
jgi:putative FmdB family regulatory protein